MWTRSNIHRKIYLLSLFGVVASLPLNKVALSISGMLMAINWLAEADFLNKFSRLKVNKFGLLLAVLFVVLAATLLYSDDLAYGMKDLRIKLPMLLFPVVILSSAPVEKREYKFLIGTFIASVFIVSAVNYCCYVTGFKTYEDIRFMSLFDSHIRLSIMISALFFVSLIWGAKSTGLPRWLLWICSLWFLFYTFKSEVLTGYFTILITSCILLIWWLAKRRIVKPVFLVLGSFGLILIILFGLYKSVYPIPKENREAFNLNTLTELGNPYHHDSTSTILENGYYIHYFIAPTELEDAWQDRFGQSLLNNEDERLYPTLLRYMTSKGLKKDAKGFAQLTEHDLKMINDGIPSVNYASGGLNASFSRITMEVQKHLEGADPNGSTIQQRIAYWSAGLNIIKEHYLFGVGIGDLQAAFDAEFERVDSKLFPENRLHTHQQFFTIWICAGLIGIILFLIYIVAQFYFAVQFNSLVLLIFSSAFTFSYFFEDTLETQVGVSLAAFFITFILNQEKDHSFLK